MENRGSFLSFSGENAPAQLRHAWHTLEKVPFGRQIFSRTIGRLAPYTGSIPATVMELARGRSLVRLEDRPKVRNHLRCVHAVALVNLAELAGNVALAYSMPSDARFIVAGISIEYLKKARGPIRAEGRCPEIASKQRAEYLVNVSMRDRHDQIVATATLRTLVGPQR